MSTVIKLVTVTCNQKSDTFGHDEVYIKYKIDGKNSGRFPEEGYQKMDNGDVWQVGLTLSFSNSLTIELYDDDTGKDGVLGTQTYIPADPQPSSIPVVGAYNASYTLATTK